MTFHEISELMEAFLKSLSRGILIIPVSKKYGPGSELELNVVFPDLAQPQLIPGRVRSENPEKKMVEVELADRAKFQDIINMLARIPAYQEMLQRLRMPVVIVEEAVEEEIIVPRREPAGAEAPPAEKSAGPEAKNGGQANKQKPEPEARPSLEPGTEPESESKPEAKHEEKPTESQERIVPDFILQLKEWLLLDQPIEKKRHKKPHLYAKDDKLPTDAGAKELTPAISNFVQSLIKAMLRTGYYSPTHPESGWAKQGLYQEFLVATGDANEFGFMLLNQVGHDTEMLVGGICAEPMALKKLLGAGSAELFFPKYMDYFSRKRLINLTIKKGISEGHFNRFVDIMSDPTVDSGAASGHLLTRMLVESEISNISTVFEDDLIKLESKLPWPVEMSIQRLAKDLKVLRLFEKMDDQEKERIKHHIVQDILRPLRQPSLLKDLILNSYLISREVPGIKEEEIEDIIVNNLPFNLLAATSELVYSEYKTLKESKPKAVSEQVLWENRVRSVRRVLIKMADRIIDSELVGGEHFLEMLFGEGMIEFDELPDSVKLRINTQKMTDDFQKRPRYWLDNLVKTERKDDIDLFFKFFAAITPRLVAAKNWDTLYLLTDMLVQNLPAKAEALQALGFANPLAKILGDSAGILAAELIQQSNKAHQNLDQIILSLGEIGLQAVYHALVAEEQPARRKMLMELLVKFGPKATELFRSILDEPSLPPQLQVLALEALGRAKNQQDGKLVKRYLKHSRPELRAEAITALVRIIGWDAFHLLNPMLSDPSPAVIKRVLAALGGFATKHNEAKAALMKTASDQKLSPDIRGQALRELGQALPLPSEMRETLQQELLKMVFEGEGFGRRLRLLFGSHSKEQDRVKLASLDLLGKIGDETALKKLSRLKISGKELKFRLGEVLNQLNLRLGASVPRSGN